MSFRPVAAMNLVLRTAAAMTVAGAALVSVSLTSESLLHAQPPKAEAPPDLRLSDEAAGLDVVVQALISAFDQADIIALGETHQWRLDTDLRIAVVRHPDFAKKVRSIVVEFGSTTEQPTLTVIFEARMYPEPSWSRSGRLQPRPPTESGTARFTRSFSQPSAMSIRGCLPMREFVCSGVIPDQETIVAVRPPPSPF